jgi:hypothetical protein
LPAECLPIWKTGRRNDTILDAWVILPFEGGIHPRPFHMADHTQATNPPPLSRRFLEFAGSDLPDCKDEAEFMATVRVYGIAWNRAAFADGSRNAREIDRYIAGLPDAARLPMQTLYAELIARKRRMFPDDTRIISDTRLKRSGGVVSLEVLHSDASLLGQLSFPQFGRP